MTNAMIILDESVRLMEKGLLKGTGQFFEYERNGEIVKLELPEEIHTFNGWKERGYSVKKGEKSTIRFPIWKYTSKEKDDSEKTGNALEDAPITNMFLKMSAFFTIEQVELIKGVR